MIDDLIPNIVFISIKSILELFVYVSIIALSFKAITALNIYIKKNSWNHRFVLLVLPYEHRARICLS